MAKTKKKKTFFREDTKARIKKKSQVVVDSLPEIECVGEDEFVLVPSFAAVEAYGSRKFKKHAEEVRLKRYRSMVQAIRSRKTPVQLREQAFNAVSGHNYCGYSFMPLGRDRRKRA